MTDSTNTDSTNKGAAPPESSVSLPPAEGLPRPIWLQAIVGLVMAIVALVVFFLIIGLFLPSSYRVERSIVINASPQKIHPYVEDLKRWPDWTTWNTANYPKLEYQYEGDALGKGAVETWTDPDNGDGRLEITKSSPDEGIAFVLNFAGFDDPLIGQIIYSPTTEGGSTQVNWIAVGNLGSNPINRYFGLMMDSLMGGDYETSLSNLKRLAEADAAP